MRAWIIGVALCAAVPAAARADVDAKTTAEFDRRMAPLVCARAVRCGTIGRSELAECLKGGRKSRVRAAWPARTELRVDRLWKRGQFRVEMRGSGACLRWWKTAPCRVDSTTAPKHCYAMVLRAYLRPNVKPGGRCTRNGACIGGFCTASVGCWGRCKAYSKLGGRCGPWQLCDENLVCHGRKCVARVGAGGACGKHYNDCKDGLFCSGYRPGNWRGDPHSFRRMTLGVCKARPTVNQPCGPAADKARCVSGSYCDLGSRRAVCRKRLGRGATCRWTNSCADGLRCIGLRLGGRSTHRGWKGVSKAGVCRPHLDRGEPCDYGAYYDGCPFSMRCDRNSKTCVAKPRIGDRCKPGGCGGGLYCKRRTKRCARKLPVGARCVPARNRKHDPCFVSSCSRRTRRCTAQCSKRRR